MRVFPLEAFLLQMGTWVEEVSLIQLNAAVYVLVNAPSRTLATVDHAMIPASFV